MLSSAVYVIKYQVLGLQRAFFQKKIQGLVVPRSIMTNMNHFDYQYDQTCLSSIMKSMKYVWYQKCPVSVIMSNNYLFQASNVPRSLMTNMNNFEYQ
jgi:hypothetical protein